MEPVRKRQHHRLQYIPVALIRAAFRIRLKFPVEFKNGSVGQTLTLTMASEHVPQGRKNPRLPINQSAVAVKADGGETREIHRHGSSESIGKARSGKPSKRRSQRRRPLRLDCVSTRRL